ncbi:oxidoreductase [Cohnella pontilimi]|uniref:Oxidoreductase n=1 Tax=Cohnella pontilimi TaxID=2564100 RepID=A0A4U0FCC3_9BACL|nr:molybdopterin-dependent oxidoreductase [Cohnella pontilimi]TJY41864.1 oxidoreductase [Cohnella pontilimi]
MTGKKPGFGRQLAELHRWNAWITLFLAVSGLLLSWAAIRGWLGEGRVWLKQLHIAVGVVFGILIVLYAPLMRRHLKQLKERTRQKGNLAFVLMLLVGWLLSGIVLWQLRHFPPRWANAALLVHDLLTYIGLPYLVYHSVTRLRWMKQPGRRAIREHAAETRNPAADPPPYPASPSPWMDRRQFLKRSLGVALTVTAVPPFFRWLARQASLGPISGTVTPGENPNRMIPAPQPLPDSVNVIGGGAQGSFQVYTVTRLPTFDSGTWRFILDGLVEKPAEWTWEQFLGIPRVVQVSDFHCVTGWSVYRNTWEGIPLSYLLKQAGVRPKAKFVKFYSGDGVYTDALSLEQANMDGVMVAVLHDGQPIHRDYGGPVRLIVPKMYAYKSVKWLDRIELIDGEHIGYWEDRGYDKDAWLRGQGV